MNNAFVSSAAAVSVVLAMMWFPPGHPGEASALRVPSPGASHEQSREGGSDVPCAAPLRWRITRVDSEFGLTEADAARVIAEGAALWETAVETPLFVHDPIDGFPIQFVFDERQERTLARARRERDLDEAIALLDAQRAELVERNRSSRGSQDRYEEAGRSYERAMAEHNATVRLWNERGGAPQDVAQELEARARVLAEERRGLDEGRRALEAELNSLRRDENRFNERVASHREQSDELVRAFPSSAVQSGEYHEVVRREDGRLVSVRREIRIYRFSSDADLRLVAAHEFGHALGLGHSRLAEAVMSEQHTRGGAESSGVEIHADDVEQLGARCPDLGVRTP